MKHTIKNLIQLVRSIWNQRNGINKEILYFNWWDLEKRQWFNDFLIHHGVLKPSKRFQLIMIGTLGPRWVGKFPTKKPKVFFTAEDTTFRFQSFDDYMHGNVNLSLGFKEDDSEKSKLNLPLWMIYNISPRNFTLKKNYDNRFKYSVNDFIDQIESRNDFESRPYDIALICSHDNRGNGIGNRALAIDTFESYGFRVHSEGRFRRNSTLLESEFKDDHLSFLRKCKFYICLENTSAPGYVTEKLFDAFLTGSIPIYWGSHGTPQPDVLTGDGIVFFDPDHPLESLNLVRRLSEDNSFRTDFCSKAKTTNDAAAAIHRKLQNLRDCSSSLLHAKKNQ